MKMLIEPGQHDVVLVQDMHPFPAGALNAPIPNTSQTIVLWFAMNCHSIASDVTNQLYRRTIGRTIIHHLDLHLCRSWILL